MARCHCPVTVYLLAVAKHDVDSAGKAYAYACSQSVTKLPTEHKEEARSAHQGSWRHGRSTWAAVTGSHKTQRVEAETVSTRHNLSAHPVDMDRQISCNVLKESIQCGLQCTRFALSLAGKSSSLAAAMRHCSSTCQQEKLMQCLSMH